MNAKRRKAIETIMKTLGNLASIDDITSALSEAKDELESLRDEEDEAFNNMPEGLQQGDRGQAVEAARDALQEAVDKLDEIVTALEGFEEIEGHLETAISG